jgi:hypothetical protein
MYVVEPMGSENIEIALALSVGCNSYSMEGAFPLCQHTPSCTYLSSQSSGG